jgi:hypothetical protein
MFPTAIKKDILIRIRETRCIPFVGNHKWIFGVCFLKTPYSNKSEWADCF